MADQLTNALKLRVLSAVILAPVVLAAVYAGGWFYIVLIAVMGLILVGEWFNMVGRRVGWLVFGAFYIAISIWALWKLRVDADWGLVSVFWLLGVVWGADTGGYLFGSTIGGPKLAPAVSPKKTWSGFIGGTLLGALAGWGVISVYHDDLSGIEVLAFGAVMAVVSQAGDLFESWVKRRFSIKDSGNIIPGHGGVFDRVDGLVAVAVVFALINLFIQGNVLSWLV